MRRAVGRMRRRSTTRIPAALWLTGALLGGPLAAEPPALYSEPHHQSPVRGMPDDLLLLAGDGLSADDTVIYRLIGGGGLPARPERVPEVSTADSGVAPIVSDHGAPLSLVVHLPDAMLAGRAYALWARNADGEWSEPVTINDARPLWLSPARVYSTQAVAGVPRYLKVIGRNLQAVDGVVTRVRLNGPETVTLTAETVQPVLDEHVARVSLPELKPGAYRVELSRDGESWVPVAGQLLEVSPDPSAREDFFVSNAACRPDDGRDDTLCIRRALAAASEAAGSVRLGAGVWDLAADSEGASTRLVVPRGVSMIGAGAGMTVLVRHRPGGRAEAAVTLTGSNTISGFTFTDAARYSAPGQAGPFLRLGTGEPGTVVEDVVITANVFDRTMIGLGGSDAPVERLLVTHNEFGSFQEGVRLAGNRFDVTHRFRVVDSIIAYNSFKPGSLLDEAAVVGPIASEIGGSYRLDFSHNVADGAATDYLYAPDDPPGWRAGFFWHMNENNEMLLVSDNTATCTGDKLGDGEAIAFDNNGNTFGLDAAATVLSAGSDYVTIAGPLRARQHDREIPLASYYVGHWVQVGTGRGLGQARKITAYRIDAERNEVTLTVSPGWDVVPEPGATRISIGRAFWQAYVLANSIDHRRPPCEKSNRTAVKGGAIVLWAQNADSVVAGNRQYDTDGILFHSLYTERVAGSACNECARGTFHVTFVAIRDNTIAGEYAADDACSSSGIIGSVAAGPDAAPMTVGFGVSISHNVLSGTDARHGGAITFTSGWYAGPPPNRWPLVAGTLIHHNRIDGLSGRPALRCGTDRTERRTAIHLADAALVTGSVLYANTCPDAVRRYTEGQALRTVRYCPGTAAATGCACAGRSSGQ